MTRRHTLTTTSGKLRLMRAAGETLRHLLPDRADALPDAAQRFAGRLTSVGLHTTPRMLTDYAVALDALDGMNNGRYDLPYLMPDLLPAHDWERARDALEARYLDDLAFLEGLATVPLR